MRRILLALCVGASFLLAQTVAADVLRTDHPTEYVVVKGDTLWDISGRFLEKPWQWPQIWQKNPQVKDPHWIYPGDVIRLTYVNGKPVLTVNEAPSGNQAPVGAIDVDLYSRPYLKDLRVVNSFQDMPYVIGNQDGQLLGKEEGLVYVHGLRGVAVGDSVEIFRPTAHFARDYQGSAQRTASAPLNFRGDRHFVDSESFWKGTFTSPTSADYIGTELMRVAIGTITKVTGNDASVSVEDANREIRQGDRVAPAANTDYDPYYFPTPGPELGNARILAVRDGMVGAGRSVVALAVGSKQGVSNGNTFSVWSLGDVEPDRVAHKSEMNARLDTIRLPSERVGTIMVFRTFDNVSYAIVMMNASDIHVGDYLKSPDAQ